MQETPQSTPSIYSNPFSPPPIASGGISTNPFPKAVTNPFATKSENPQSIVPTSSPFQHSQNNQQQLPAHRQSAVRSLQSLFTNLSPESVKSLLAQIDQQADTTAKGEKNIYNAIIRKTRVRLLNKDVLNLVVNKEVSVPSLLDDDDKAFNTLTKEKMTGGSQVNLKLFQKHSPVASSALPLSLPGSLPFSSSASPTPSPVTSKPFETVLPKHPTPVTVPWSSGNLSKSGSRSNDVSRRSNRIDSGEEVMTKNTEDLSLTKDQGSPLYPSMAPASPTLPSVSLSSVSGLPMNSIQSAAAAVIPPPGAMSPPVHSMASPLAPSVVNPPANVSPIASIPPASSPNDGGEKTTFPSPAAPPVISPIGAPIAASIPPNVAPVAPMAPVVSPFATFQPAPAAVPLASPFAENEPTSYRNTYKEEDASLRDIASRKSQALHTPSGHPFVSSPNRKPLSPRSSMRNTVESIQQQPAAVLNTNTNREEAMIEVFSERSKSIVSQKPQNTFEKTNRTKSVASIRSVISNEHLDHPITHDSLQQPDVTSPPSLPNAGVALFNPSATGPTSPPSTAPPLASNVAAIPSSIPLTHPVAPNQPYASPPATMQPPALVASSQPFAEPTAQTQPFAAPATSQPFASSQPIPTPQPITAPQAPVVPQAPTLPFAAPFSPPRTSSEFHKEEEISNRSHMVAREPHVEERGDKIPKLFSGTQIHEGKETRERSFAHRQQSPFSFNLGIRKKQVFHPLQQEGHSFHSSLPLPHPALPTQQASHPPSIPPSAASIPPSGVRGQDASSYRETPSRRGGKTTYRSPFVPRDGSERQSSAGVGGSVNFLREQKTVFSGFTENHLSSLIEKMRRKQSGGSTEGSICYGETPRNAGVGGVPARSRIAITPRYVSPYLGPRRGEREQRAREEEKAEKKTEAVGGFSDYSERRKMLDITDSDVFSNCNFGEDKVSKTTAKTVEYVQRIIDENSARLDSHKIDLGDTVRSLEQELIHWQSQLEAINGKLVAAGLEPVL